MRLSLLLAVAACSYDPPPAVTPGDDAAIDMGVEVSDAHLVFTEIFAESGAEFIEIYNPLSTAVPLGNVYLTDVAGYWALPAGVPTAINSDFLAKFPDGSEIAPGAAIVVAIDGPVFAGRFQQAPTYTLRMPTAGAAALTLLSPAPTMNAITDDGEMLVLFEWDGVSDLVRDLDIVVHGIPSANNGLTAKQAVDGPDADTATSAYATDANVNMRMTTRTADGGNASYQRSTLDEQETRTGGNGITGHDETSEPLDTTWTSTGTPNPGAVPF